MKQNERKPLNRPPLCNRIGCPLKAERLTTMGPRCVPHGSGLAQRPLEVDDGH